MSLFHRRGSDGGKGFLTSGDVGHSPNGTPLNEILHVKTDENPRKWLSIPVGWGGAFFYSGPDAFAETMAPPYWGLWKEQNPGAPDPDSLAVGRTRSQIQYYAERFGGFDRMRLFETVTFLHMPSPPVTVMPVRCCVDDGPGLTADMAALVVDPNAIEPPTVEKFRTNALGTWTKATRRCLYDAEPGQDPDQRGMWVSVRYAFKVPGRQAVVTVVATHDDLGRMAAAQPDLEEFVNTITLTFADGRPFAPDPAP